jgi:hypothetical protein
MRMWLVDPGLLCKKHLLGEHVEMHMFAGSIRKRISLCGYIKKGLVDLRLVNSRHDALAAEMLRRGMKHESKLDPIPFLPAGEVDVENSLAELSRRCSKCREIIEKRC